MYCNGSRRILEVREVKGHRRNIARTKEDRERGRERWFEEDDMTRIKTAYDCRFSPQPTNRLKSCPSCREGFQE